MEEYVKQLENKIEQLEEKVDKLEQIERRRKIKKIISASIKLIALFAILILIEKTINYVKETYIDPYQETITELQEKYETIKNNDIINNIFNR